MESNADLLMRSADELLYEKKDFKGAIQLYREAATLYQSSANLHLAASALMKIGLGLQDKSTFYQEAIQAYEEAAQLYQQDGNQESSSNSLLSAAFVAEKKNDRLVATKLFLEAGKGFQGVAQKRKVEEHLELAWDSLQLACTCWKNALRNTGALPAED